MSLAIFFHFLPDLVNGNSMGLLSQLCLSPLSGFKLIFSISFLVDGDDFLATG
jgi:hypothetical protein